MIIFLNQLLIVHTNIYKIPLGNTSDWMELVVKLTTQAGPVTYTFTPSPQATVK